MMLKNTLNATLCACIFFLLGTAASPQELLLRNLIDEALTKNPEIAASKYRVDAGQAKIPQVKSLPDPMLMVGYQNVGLSRYSYGDYPESQWMFTATQAIPFPGKRSLRGEMAERDADSLNSMYEAARFKTIARVKELYYDLFLLYRNIDLIRDQQDLVAKVEAIALARYASGTATQQEVLMAQAEKYMLLEKEEMFKQKIRSDEAMLRNVLGRSADAPVGRPSTSPPSVYDADVNTAVARAIAHSPEIKAREKMVEGAQAKLKMARKEYYPDFAVAASVYPRGGDMQEIWGLAATINIPLYFRTRQDPAVQEMKASLSQATQELEAAKLMITAAVQDNYAMMRAAENLMKVYREGLIPKTRQEFDQAVSGYGTGKTEAIVAVTRLKNVLEYETLYWSQYAEKEKAIARLHSLTAEATDTVQEAGAR